MRSGRSRSSCASRMRCISQKEAKVGLTVSLVCMALFVVSSTNLLISLTCPNRPDQTLQVRSQADEQRVIQAALNGRAMQTTSSSIGQSQAATKLRVCYFRMDPKTEIRLHQVDGSLCTHIILAFVRLDSEGNLVIASDSDLGYLAEVPDFKRKHPGVKLMVSVFNEDQFNGFPRAAACASNRQQFARSAMDFLQRYQLDGLDLDWEFPNFPTGFVVAREHERVGLTRILKSLRSAVVENFFDRQQRQRRHQQQLTNTYPNHHLGEPINEEVVEPYLLTVALAGQEAVMRASYQLRELANLVDWFNVMTYDYFQFKTYTPFTGPNAPLNPIVEGYVPILSKLSLSWTVGRLLEEQIGRDKIVLGIPTYARAYRLMFRNSQASPFTLAVGSRPGRLIDDYLDYREVCDILARPDVSVEFDERARVPYLLTDDGYTWVSFENEISVREKVRLVMDRQLAGYMTWNLNSDDFEGSHATKLTQTSASASGANGAPSTEGSLTSVTFPLHRAMLDELFMHAKR